MRILGFSRYVLTSCAAAAMLAGCGGSQPPIGAPGAMPQSSAVATHAGRGKSWMKAGASKGNLLYLSGGCGGTCVVSFPDGALVGGLNVGGAGARAHASGNVYIADQAQLLEYSHGGITPVSTFNVSSGELVACSVDIATGSVAVVTFESQDFNVAIFPNGSGTPKTYTVAGEAQYCGYDNSGDLFVDGYSGSEEFDFYELPTGGSDFQQVTINKTVKHPGQVQWDGKYLAVESIGVDSGVSIYRLSISGSQASVENIVPIHGVKASAQSWIYGKRLFLPYSFHGNVRKLAGAWTYPKGGRPQVVVRKIDQNANYQGVTYSPASS